LEPGRNISALYLKISHIQSFAVVATDYTRCGAGKVDASGFFAIATSWIEVFNLEQFFWFLEPIDLIVYLCGR
jgi:hypothetical protein